MKKTGIALVVAFALATTGCASMMNGLIASAMSKGRAPNLMLMHKDPKVGDYAVLKSVSIMQSANNVGNAGNATKVEGENTFEIVGFENELYVVSLKTLSFVNGKPNAMVPEVAFEFRVTAEGEVKEAYFLNGKKPVAMKVAQSGDYEYVKYDFTDSITVPLDLKGGGTKESYVLFQEYDLAEAAKRVGNGTNAANVKGKATNIAFVDPSRTIPFCILGTISGVQMSGDAARTEFSADKITTYYGKEVTNSTGYGYLAEYGNRGKK